MVVIRLSRVGYDYALGYLKGGIGAWKAAGKETDSIDQINPDDFAKLYDSSPSPTLDVRKESEFAAQHLDGAENFPLDFINRLMEKVDPAQKYYVHCQGGYRSLIAISILKSRGYHDMVNVVGGFKEIKNFSEKVTAYQEPETML